MIGMRDMSDYGKDVTRYFARECVNDNYVIVSGMAKGVDSVAHQTALDYHDNSRHTRRRDHYCYPRCNKDLYEELCQHHLVLSEYPYSVAPKKYQFPFRNRIVAGLSQSVLISEARQKEWNDDYTEGYALEQGKDVYCVPSRINDYQGCNELINKEQICDKYRRYS